MLKVGELYGTLKLDDKDFRRGVDGARSTFGGLVGGVAKGGLVIAGALAGVGAAGGALAFKLGGVAGDLNETMSKVNVVFGDLGDEMMAWGKDSATAFGMSQNAALGAAGTYGNLFRAMGISTEASADMSQGLVELAADLASFNNMDPTEVLDKLRAGLSGETEPLKTLGVNLSAARVEAKALEMGLWDGTGAIDAAAKAQATYALVLEDTKLAQGDFARTSDGMANQQRILAATFEDSMARVGQAFVPVIEALLPQITSALVGFADMAIAALPTVQAIFTEVFSVVGGIITGFVETVWPMLLAAFTFFIDEIVPLFVGEQTKLQASLGQEGTGGIFTWLAETVVPILAAAFDFITGTVIPAAAAAFDWISTNVIPVLAAAFAGVVSWISANWPTISSIVGQVAGAIGTAFGVISSVIGAVWPVVERVATVLFPLVGSAAGVLLSALDVAFKAIGGVFTVVGSVASTVFSAITRVWGGLSSFFGRVWSGVTGAFKGGLNALIGPINAFLRFLNGLAIYVPSIEIPFVGRVGGFGVDPFNFGLIPRLATGGLISRGGMAIVGEEGPELVALGAGAQVIPNGQAFGGGLTVQGPFIEHFEATTPDYDADRLLKLIDDRTRLRTPRRGLGSL